MSSCHTGCRLKPCALGAAIAILWALTLLLISLLAIFLGVGFPWLGIIASLYVGFSLTIGGIIIGLVWALIDGFITGVVLAWLYNWLSGCCHAKSEVSDH